uniref:Uncharacterized protein n=2 Tax=Plectus sambesii TaxID=2011161 RepID=A0A914WZC7_9BILA
MPGFGGSVAAAKNQQKDEAATREKKAQEEIASFHALYTPQYFLSQTPAEVGGAAIPEWKRALAAKKLAEAAIQKEEERIMKELEEWKLSLVPNWKKTPAQQAKNLPAFSHK